MWDLCSLTFFCQCFLKLAYDENFKFTKTNLDVFILLFALVMFISSVTSFARNSSMKNIYGFTPFL
ncbi:MAG: hypothetical protein L6V93_22300 [Clostridiales bacterium]|nr:MAG: hypothetical protein L6V93_22300 [Clostridiales bacterium]